MHLLLHERAHDLLLHELASDFLVTSRSERLEECVRPPELCREIILAILAEICILACFNTVMANIMRFLTLFK